MRIFTVALMISLVLFNTVLANSMKIRVINLKSQNAQEVANLLQGVLPPGSKVSGEGQQLLIKTTDAGFEQLKPLLHQLDKQPQNLLLSVRRVHNSAYDDWVKFHGHTSIYETQTRDQQDHVQQVVLQNGQSAMIQQDKTLPLQNLSFAEQGNLAWNSFPWGSYGQGHYGGMGFNPIEYKDISSGVILTPTLHGEEVSLEISWHFQQLENDFDNWQQQLSPIGGEQTATSLTIPLGQWVPISNQSTRNQVNQRVKEYNTADLSEPGSHLLVKVELQGNYHAQHSHFPNGVWEEKPLSSQQP